MTRQHSFDGCVSLAPRLARGLSVTATAREVDLPVYTVQTRIKAMRARLSSVDSDPSWLDYRNRTHTEVGAAWVERGWANEPPPDPRLREDG